MVKNNIKFLIAGAKGQLGQEFAQEFKKRKIAYLALEKNKFDITNFKKVEEIIKKYKPKFLINCAAYNNTDKAEDEWKTAFLVNGVGPKNLAIASKNNNCILIHYSTDYVFDGRKKSPYTIIDIPRPINKYGQSKLLGEQFVQKISDKYYLIRLSSVFGNNPKASFPLKLLSWAKGREELKIAKDQTFSPSSTKDIVLATLQLIKSGQYGLYHMTNSNFCSRYEWAKFILKEIKWPGKILPAKSSDFKSKAKRPKFSVLDNSRLEHTIGYRQPTWQEATKEFLKLKLSKQ